MNKQASDPGNVQASLRKSVQQALERKRRLGQYAVIWREGKPVQVRPGIIPAGVQETSSATAYDARDQDRPDGRKQT